MEPDSLTYAIAYAEKIASTRSPASRDLILLTHTKDQIRNTSLAGFLGDNVVKAFGKGRDAGLPSGTRLHHATKQTISSWLPNSIVIVFYAEDGILEFVDGLHGLAAVVAVPDFPDSVDNWIERWNPVVHGAKPQPDAKLLQDPVVEVALKAVSGMSNLAHSVMHPGDKERAKEVLRILKTKGHELDSHGIKSWAIKNGWHPKAAEELAGVAKKVAALKTKPSLKGIYDPEGRYARWKKGAVTD